MNNSASMDVNTESNKLTDGDSKRQFYEASDDVERISVSVNNCSGILFLFL